jgi:hypothetical protein
MCISLRGGAMNAPNSVQIEPEETIQVIFTEKGTSFVKVKDRKPVEIRVVEDQPCPYCGSKFPNRPKVHDEKGWWWRCYTEECPVGYYQPEKMLVELRGAEETISYDELLRRFKR